jgi:hypothetical protein
VSGETQMGEANPLVCGFRLWRKQLFIGSAQPGEHGRAFVPFLCCEAKKRCSADPAPNLGHVHVLTHACMVWCRSHRAERWLGSRACAGENANREQGMRSRGITNLAIARPSVTPWSESRRRAFIPDARARGAAASLGGRPATTSEAKPHSTSRRAGWVPAREQGENH